MAAVALLSISVGMPQARHAGSLTPKQIFAKFHASVVKIVTDTGFFIQNGSLVATCYHVIEGAQRLAVEGTDGASWSVEFVYVDKGEDAAI